MVKKKSKTNWGSISYIIGLCLVVLFAIFGWINPVFISANWLYLTLALLGIFVGLVNITDQEKDKFLLASVALLLTSITLKTAFAFWVAIPFFFNLMVAFVAPAAAIIALIEVLEIAKK